tara:strand:+ start:488 stop:649 length:162 start_codon:yes stop_codon:yes gene_type:complete
MNKKLLTKLENQLKEYKAKGVKAFENEDAKLGLNYYALCMKIELAIDSVKENK